VTGFRWLASTAVKLSGCVLADDMGLGKTVQVCADKSMNTLHPKCIHTLLSAYSTILAYLRAHACMHQRFLYRLCFARSAIDQPALQRTHAPEIPGMPHTVPDNSIPIMLT
jgi:SNF2-related domain